MTKPAKNFSDSWRERRVQELEELLAKRSGCSRCDDSAPNRIDPRVVSEIRSQTFKEAAAMVEAGSGRNNRRDIIRELLYVAKQVLDGD